MEWIMDVIFIIEAYNLELSSLHEYQRTFDLLHLAYTWENKTWVVKEGDD